MSENPFIPLIQKALDREDLSLPIFNRIALELQKLMRERDYSLSEVTRIIQKDPGLTSDILKLANSSFYAGMAPAKTVQDATVRLGAKTIFNLVTAVTQKELYRSKKKRFEAWMKPLWSHSLGVAFASRWLSLHSGMRQRAEESFMAGLLHDVGKLIILRGLEDLDASEVGPEADDLIRQAVDQVHGAKGKEFMERMNMPQTYCRVAGLHHSPQGAEEDGISSVVVLANLACRKKGIGLKHDPGLDLSSTREADLLKLQSGALEELQVMLDGYMEVLSRL